jgi:salicylate hydroxylase
MANSSSIKIAVIGGGLAGATIAHALLRHAHLDVHVYESAPEFSERGAAVGLASEAQDVLKQVIGPAETSALLEKAGAVVHLSSRICIVRLLTPVPEAHVYTRILTVFLRDRASMRGRS